MDEARHDELDWEEVDVNAAVPVDADDEPELDDLDADTDEGDDPFSQPAGQGDRSTSAADVDVERRPAPARSALRQSGASPDEDSCPITPKTILESILFVGTPDNRPIPATEIAALMRGVRADEVDELVLELNEEYETQGSALLVESESGGYRLALRRELQDVRNRFYGRVKDAKLSQAAVDILAIIAYRQPVSKTKIDELRGKSAGSIVNQLLRRQLIESVPSEDKPNQRVLKTTGRFLEVFGLRNLGELPHSEWD